MGRKRSDGWPEGVEPRRGSVRLVFQYLGRRCRETLRIPPTPANRKYAERKRATIILEIEKGIFDYALHFPSSAAFKRARSQATTSVEQGCRNWLRGRVQRAYTRQVNTGYIDRHVAKDPIGKMALGLVLPSELLDWRARLATKVSAKTANNVMILVHGAFTLAHADGAIKRNPATGLKNLRKVKKSHADPFDPAELHKLGEVPRKPELRNMIEAWWNGGFREGEIFGLEWPDVDWTRKGVQVRRSIVRGKVEAPKDYEERFVRLGPRGMAALTRQRAHTQLAGGRIFLNPETGEPFRSVGRFARRMQRWCKRAGIRYRPPKQLRHTYASMALSAGEPTIYVRDQLGHATLQMIEETYAKWIEGARKDVGKGFEEAAALV